MSCDFKKYKRLSSFPFSSVCSRHQARRMSVTVLNVNRDVIPDELDYDETHGYNKRVFEIGRPYTLGNPFRLIDHGLSRTLVVKLYAVWLEHMMQVDTGPKLMMNHILEAMMDGCDVYLKCYCKPLLCHGDVIKSVLEDRYLRHWERMEYLLTLEPDVRAQEEHSVIVDYYKNVHVISD